MSRLHFTGFGALVLVAFTAVSACDEDSGGSGGTGGKAGSAGTAGSGTGGSTGGSGGSTGGSGGSTGGSGGSGATAPDAGADHCQSASDKAGLSSVYLDGGAVPDGSVLPEGGTAPKTVSGLVTAACIGCLSDPNRDACILDCLKTNTGSSVSDGCLTCVINQVTCAIDSGCTALCLGSQGADAPACIECRCGAGTTTSTHRNCIEEYDTCTGPGVSTTSCADAG